MRPAVFFVLLAACSGRADDDTIAGTDIDTDDVTDSTPTPTSDTRATPTADTGPTTPPTPADLTASCALQQGNTLRFQCELSVDPPQGVEIAFAKSDGSGPERIHTSTATQASHTIDLYFMASETEYRWTARSIADPTGATIVDTVTTGGLPDGARVQFDNVAGTSTAAMFGLASPCQEGAYAVVMTPEGELLWYQDLLSGPIGFVEGVSFTEDQTVLAVISDNIVEVDLMGNTLVHLTRGADLPEHVHHDAFKRDGRIYAIFQENVNYNGEDWLLDGVFVFDGPTLLDTFHLIDHYQPTTRYTPGIFPDDRSHANSVWVDTSGNILLSLRHLSGILKIDGIDTPTFGNVQWTMSGDAASDLGSDFGVGTSLKGAWGSFLAQHNVHVLDDGRYALFDNRRDLLQRSRLVVMDVDETGLTAEIQEEYGLDIHCDFQGGHLYTAAGNPVGTCAPYRRAYEFDIGGTDPRWEAEANCQQGVPQYVPRFVPLDW